ncbi:MAG: hypothetical protein ABF483_08390 [Liquorilactobacillus nagelii]|jgi:hypothetical protein|uniref:Ethanolamine utilization protein n=2 Tax=Liquorilactobacillus nagelii TaxID=82688 RepID=A0A3Q8CCW9_9LACO|nr:hypothetical protein [Liquorilactobacillus nagelii]AUJ32729.1 hypothetical protein BSQ50_09400 [Liquorilactobacillus nagelii]MCC7616948.1 hypothetical protein [Liquorilactobacillus nagelii]MCP9315629.1 hypothetical protein [Liquorilactobacillus nagelii]
MDQKQLDTIVSKITEQIISRLQENGSDPKQNDINKANLYLLTDESEAVIKSKFKQASFLWDQYKVEIINFNLKNYKNSFPKNLSKEDKVVLMYLPFYDIAKAALGIVDDIVTFWMSKTFLLGSQVLLLKKVRDTTTNNGKYKELLSSYKRTLNEFGLCEIDWNDLNKNSSLKLMSAVLTSADIEKIPFNSSVCLKKSAILTDLAKKKITEKNLKIIYR